MIIGYVLGKAYYLATVFGDRLFRRGAGKKWLLIFGILVVAVFWIYSAMLYLDVIYFPWPFPRWYGGSEFMLNSGLPLGLTKTPSTDISAPLIFATYPFWFYLGSKFALAHHRLRRSQKEKERNRIIVQVAATAFPSGGVPRPGASEVDSAALIESLFNKIPPLFVDVLTVLFFAFDSRFFVFAFTGKFQRFVNLGGKGPSWEKTKYMQAWEANQFLTNAVTVLEIIVSYGYYTRAKVYELLDYNGPSLPYLPCWYNGKPIPYWDPCPKKSNGGGGISR